jgi:murein DD-endopeptidase MepM/ murein hydrolase activator NlpD
LWIKKRFPIWSIIILSNDANKPITKLRVPKFIFYFSLFSIFTITSTLALAYIITNDRTTTLETEYELLAKQLKDKETLISTLQEEQSLLQNHAINVETQLKQLKTLENKIREMSHSLNPDTSYFNTDSPSMGGLELKETNHTHTYSDYIVEKEQKMYESDLTIVDKYTKITTELPSLINQYEETITNIEKLKKDLQITPTIWPTNVFRVTSTFGTRKDPITRRNSFHSGIDIAGPWGSPIYATADGIVASAKWDGGYGYSILIEHSEEFSTRYGHLSRYIVRRGAQVKKGDIIGYMGTSGRSTGVHLHYEVIKNGEYINPDPYITFTLQQ